MDVSVFFFGLFLGFFVFTMEGVVKQTVHVWKRTRRLTHAYLCMIWVESIVNLVFASTTRGQLDGLIKSSLGYLIVTVLLWAAQTQLLSQIIANRVSLIMVSKRKSRLLRWGLFVGIGMINIAVAFIWIPGHMENATDFQVNLNTIFEHVEKSLFLMIDLGLNLYFLYLVRYRLIEEGLSKYWTLYKFNIGFVFISTTMDALLLGLLSLPNQFAYVQFAPVTYTIKLYLELKMAQLISKVVKRSMNRVDDSTSGNQSSNRGPLSYTFRASTVPKVTGNRGDDYLPDSHKMNTNVTGAYANKNAGKEDIKSEGIMKTVTTVVKTENCEEDSGRSSRTESV